MTRFTSSRRDFLSRAAGAFSIAAALPLRAADAVKVGMVPDAGATQVSIEEKAPLRDYLSKAVGAKVELIIPTNYNATVEALGNGSLDFAYLGALTYVKAHERYNVNPLVQRSADKNFHSLFITQAGSAIHKLADCKGKRFAFGDINSTSGHLIPFDELKKAGINADDDMQIRYTGSHAATVKAVEGGAADAGALDETVYHSMISEGKVDGSKVRVFVTSPSFVDYVWVARKDVGGPQREGFAKAFLSLKEGQDDAILNILRGKDFVRADDAEYANIRKIARDLKML
jgi:phosphonate transport system substrate-binding protein